MLISAALSLGIENRARKEAWSLNTVFYENIQIREALSVTRHSIIQPVLDMNLLLPLQCYQILQSRHWYFKAVARKGENKNYVASIYFIVAIQIMMAKCLFMFQLSRARTI